jgi:hypothetical protein
MMETTQNRKYNHVPGVVNVWLYAFFRFWNALVDALVWS